MPAFTAQRGLRLFKAFGIDVYLHWSWFLVAVYEINSRKDEYSSSLWNIAEYLALFVIVLLHEFGHALACRSVGGQADHIMLWPLGGVAYVNPPQRPGAVLWSIVAGPLVNVVLACVSFALFVILKTQHITLPPDLLHFLFMVSLINVVLLVFNMLPIYPLDGGKIVWALLWFVLGQARSLLVSSVIGIIGAAAVLIWAVSRQQNWFIFLALYGAFRSWQGFVTARAMAQRMNLPRHEEVRCPGCGNSPPAAPLWRCTCGANFDSFTTNATCPNCGSTFQQTSCPHCHGKFPVHMWQIVQPGFPAITPPQSSTSTVPD